MYVAPKKVSQKVLLARNVEANKMFIDYTGELTKSPLFCSLRPSNCPRFSISEILLNG